MDQLNDFLIRTFGSNTKVASAKIEPVELSATDKWAFSMLKHDGLDESFLAQFEGTPLAPQAIALCESELAMEQRHLQTRMQEAAARDMRNYDQECNEREALRLQKLGLVIQLHKMKAMTPPSQPGDAVIGQPEAAPQLGAEIGGGAAAGAMGGHLLGQLVKRKVPALDTKAFRDVGGILGAVYGAPVAVEGGRAIGEAMKTSSLADIIKGALGA